MRVDFEQFRGVSRIRNDYLNGGVSAGNEAERAESLLDHVFGTGRHLAVIDTSDFYGDGSHVSIEEAAARQTTIQQRLDQEIVRENLGETPVKRGLPPCLRVKKSS